MAQGHAGKCDEKQNTATRFTPHFAGSELDLNCNHKFVLTAGFAHAKFGSSWEPRASSSAS